MAKNLSAHSRENDPGRPVANGPTSRIEMKKQFLVGKKKDKTDMN